MIRKQLGLTMIELLVSMMLGLGLVAGIGQLFVQSQKSFALQRNLSDMMDDATFALEDLAKGILLAGYSETGTNFNCEKITITKLSDSSTTIPFNSCDYSTDTLKLADSLSDVLGSGLALNCSTTTNTTTNEQPATGTTPAIPATLSTTTQTTKCETIKGTDTSLVYRFKLDATKSQENNSVCVVNSYVIQDVVPVYVFYKDSDKSLSCTSKSASQPMISEVQKLEFRYGIHDKVTDTFYYTKAADVTDWKKVFAVKVFLVMRSADKNLTKNKTGWSIEGGETEYPSVDEKRLYKVFSKTIFLRAPSQ